MEPTRNSELDDLRNKNISFKVDIKNEYNYLMYQSDIYYKKRNNTYKITPYSLIDNIIIDNKDDVNYEDLKLSFEFSDYILSVGDIYISNVLKRSKTKITEGIKVVVDTLKLYSLNESIPLNVVVKLSDNDNIITSCTYDLILSPINEASDIVNIKELLACFVTPNAYEVNDITNRAIEHLKEIRKTDTSFIGYLANDIDSVREEMMAIYNTLREQEINYANPPASFNLFQKVRIPSNVLTFKKGTCLDLAVTYCACLENVGLRPLLILIEGHAFVGCFLNEESFVERICDDVGKIFNKSALNNLSIELVECTCFTKMSSVSFNDANVAARSKITLYDGFFNAIDIVSCHKSIFRPIPTKELDDLGNVKINVDISIFNDELKRKNSPFNEAVFEGTIENNKFNYWSKKLLDLSLRNKLINFKLTPNAPQIEYHLGIDLLYKVLNKDSIYLNPIDVTLERNKFYDFNTDNQELELLSRKNIYNIVTNDKTLKALFRIGISSIEETGSNCLYLSFGLMSYVPKNSKKALLAPIFLVPVRGKTKKGLNGYELMLDSENISINTTVFEYLHQMCDISFEELYSVEKDLNNIDINSVYNAIRSKTCSECSLSVDENKVFLSVFSFANYILWEDIHNRKKELLQNDIIKHLVEGESFVNKNEENLDLDKSLIPSNLAIPLSADSSQIKAIIDCANGKSFVLDGPPGTGKSQTIVNMIINSLYNGKKVLFVASKMAALEVVKKRIDDINLGSFCLELHSNKASRRSVLEQIEKALTFDHTKSPKSFKSSSNNLLKQRNYLNEFINKIYEEKHLLSLNSAISEYQKVSDYNLNIIDSKKVFTKINDELLQKIYDLFDNVKAIALRYGEFKDSPFYAFKTTNYTFTMYQNLKEMLDNLNNYFKVFINCLDVFNKYIKFEFNYTRDNIITLISIIKLLKNNNVIYKTLDTNEIIKNDKLSQEIIKKGLECNQIESLLSAVYTKDIYDFNPNDYLQKYDSIKNSKFKTFFFTNKLKKILKPYLIDYKQKRPLDTYIKQLEMLSHYLNNKENINKNDSFIKKLFSENYQGVASDFKIIQEIYQNTFKFKKLINSLNNQDQNISLQDLIDVFKEIDEDMGYSDFVSEDFDDLLNTYQKFIDAEISLKNVFSYDFELLSFNKDNAWKSLYDHHIENMINDLNNFEGISLFNKTFKELKKHNVLNEIIDIYKNGLTDAKTFVKYFDAYLYYNIILEYFSDPYFHEFSGIIFDQAIKKYNELLEDYTKLIIVEVASKITKDYPVQNVDYAKSTQIYGLQKCIKNGGHKTTIRNILKEYGSLIRTICPCFLMSPASAAQYLSLDSEKFDIVIFDEASQIPTCEAIGAISRGTSLVVAGDPEQMPPTSFFQSSFETSDDSGSSLDNGDLESLLDDVLALGVLRNRLLWHYRSNHESLIAFSNNAFYEHSLYTFPSPDNTYKKVNMVYVENGIYDHGINQLEAELIVKEVKRRFKDENLCKQSIGIVTFNVKQQELILDKINELLDNNKDFYDINEANKDKLFVKNLENVQGDERDVIIFSIGFGYNKDHKFNLFLGPLSLEKGERRLNVAVTRARNEMIVYSSIKSKDIISEKAKNQGASVLKQFLHYAEFGNKTLVIENNKQILLNSGIEESIQEELLKHGFKSDIFVGDSKFKINVAIKDDNDKYLLGIIIDGGINSKNNTCRDRNNVQIKMLNKLNWNIINIYSPDYMKNKDFVINSIIEAICNYQDTLIVHTPKDEIIFEKEKIELYHYSKEYVKCECEIDIDYEKLTIEFVNKAIVKALTEIIDKEGPISSNILYERFKEMLKIKKVTAKSKTIFDNHLKQVKRTKVLEPNKIVYFPKGINEKDINYYRLSSSDDREITEVPLCEIKWAMVDIIEAQGNILLNDVAKIIANFFGKKVITQQINLKINQMIKYIIQTTKAFYVDREYISIE